MSAIEHEKFDVLTEWRKFEAALILELKATPLAEFESAWRSLSDKTRFYDRVLMPKVAARLGYGLQYEFVLCDYVFWNRDRVPMVFIESENAHGTATSEIDKLCCFSSPVKALFLSCERADGERDKYLPGWKERFATHHKYCDLNAVYMTVVGEWGRGKPKDDGILRYYIESFDVFGNEIDRKELVVS
jgi:hypothetical protein